MTKCGGQTVGELVPLGFVQAYVTRDSFDRKSYSENFK